MRYCLYTLITTILCLGWANFALASNGELAVKIYDQTGVLLSEFTLSAQAETGGASITTADLGRDGVPEIIIGNGFGNEPRVRVLRQDGSEISSFLAYASNFGRGITVAACDLDQDGHGEIVTGTQYGGGPHVRVFDVEGELKFNPGFFAYAEDFRGGVNVACADIDNDGRNEIITTPGPTGGPHVKVWQLDNDTWKIDNEFFAFDANDSTGVALAIKNENGQNFLQLSHMSGTNSEIATYQISSPAEFISVYDKNLESNVITETLTVDNNSVLLMAPQLKNYSVISENESITIESEYPINLATADFDQDGSDELVTVRAAMNTGPSDGKKIVVDISEQRLYAYNNGLLEHSFLISSGTYYFPTPLGNHSVLAKKEWVDYTWNYSEGNPENYSMGLTPWNLMFKPHYYIHSAPWHDNFGNRMSHGCVNASTENAEWIYHWADVDVPVDIVE